MDTIHTLPRLRSFHRQGDGKPVLLYTQPANDDAATAMPAKSANVTNAFKAHSRR